MKRFFKIAGIVIGSIVIVCVLFFLFYFKDIIWVEKKTPEELASILTPHFIIKHPPGNGPFPTVLMFHGASGAFNRDGNVPKTFSKWHDYFVSLGYASIIVDSYTGRGFTSDDVAKVRSGRKYWGSEHAGDVLISINEVRKLSFVNPNKLALTGWSHGGSAIMSLLAMDLVEKLPPNLTTVPNGDMEGVKGAIMLYPGFPTWMMSSGGKNWNKSIKALVLLGGKDKLTEGCLKSISILEKYKNPITYHVYPDAGHTFDGLEEDLEQIPEVLQHLKQEIKEGFDPEATVDARRRVKEFLEEVFK